MARRRTDPKTCGRRPLRTLDARGVTLLEVMISMAVFAIGMIGLARMHIVASGSNAQAAKTDRANQLAEELIEYLSSLPFDHPLLADGSALDDDPLDKQDRFDVDPVPSTVVDHSEADLYAYHYAEPGTSCTAAAGDCFFGAYAIDVGGGKQPDTGLCPASDYNGDGIADPACPTTDFNGDGRFDFERFWQVVPLQNAAGTPYAKQIAVIVRWYDTSIGRYRRVVTLRTVANPLCSAPGGTATC